MRIDEHEHKFTFTFIFLSKATYVYIIPEYIYIYIYIPDIVRLYIFYLFLFISMFVSWELNPQPFALLTQCSTNEPQEHYINTIYKCKNNIPQIIDNEIKFTKYVCDTQMGRLWEGLHPNKTYDICLFKPLLDADSDTLSNKTHMQMLSLKVKFSGTCFENIVHVDIYFCLHGGNIFPLLCEMDTW